MDKRTRVCDRHGEQRPGGVQDGGHSAGNEVVAPADGSEGKQVVEQARAVKGELHAAVSRHVLHQRPYRGDKGPFAHSLGN
jgi:hypothetical protein